MTKVNETIKVALSNEEFYSEVGRLTSLVEDVDLVETNLSKEFLLSQLVPVADILDEPDTFDFKDSESFDEVVPKMHFLLIFLEDFLNYLKRKLLKF